MSRAAWRVPRVAGCWTLADGPLYRGGMKPGPPTTTTHLQSQLEFIAEMDRLKAVQRRNLISDGSRRENTAEHSWHLAMMVWALGEHAPEPFDAERALQMALVHDLVEIDAGDTFVYGDGLADQPARETRAAERIFGLLPEQQGRELWTLWREFEQGRTPEARFVRVLDRLQPLLLHQATEGMVWQQHGVRKSQVLARMKEIEDNAPGLWPVVERIIRDAVERGALLDS